MRRELQLNYKPVPDIFMEETAAIEYNFSIGFTTQHNSNRGSRLKLKHQLVSRTGCNESPTRSLLIISFSEPKSKFTCFIAGGHRGWSGKYYKHLMCRKVYHIHRKI